MDMIVRMFVKGDKVVRREGFVYGRRGLILKDDMEDVKKGRDIGVL
jgi:hypothetical protein